MKRTSSRLHEEFITLDSGSTGDNVPDPYLFTRAVDQAKVLQRTIREFPKVILKVMQVDHK